MSWNYRLVQRRDGSFGLHEVFYHPDGPPRAMTAEPVGFSVDREEGTEGLLEAMHRALKDAHDQPVLVEVEAFPEELSVIGQHVSSPGRRAARDRSAPLQPIDYTRHRFPAEVIRYAVWLYFRFTLSLRDVEELLAQRGIEVSYETVRCWAIKFGPLIAKNLRRRQPRPTGRWHIDEMVVKIAGEKRWLWRAVDDEGVVLDMLVQRRRNKKAALRLLSKLVRKTGVQPETITTDKLASYGAALRQLKLNDRHRCSGRRINNGLRTATFRSEDENGRCRDSRARPQPSASSQRMGRSTTPSTRSATSPPDER